MISRTWNTFRNFESTVVSDIVRNLRAANTRRDEVLASMVPAVPSAGGSAAAAAAATAAPTGGRTADPPAPTAEQKAAIVNAERMAIIRDLAPAIREAISQYLDFVDPNDVIDYARTLANAPDDTNNAPRRKRVRGGAQALGIGTRRGNDDEPARPTEAQYCAIAADDKLWTAEKKWESIELRADIIHRIREGIRADVITKCSDVAQKKELEIHSEVLRHIMTHAVANGMSIMNIYDEPVGMAFLAVYDRFRLLASVDGVTGAARGAALSAGAAKLAMSSERTDERYQDMGTAVRETALTVAGGAARTHAVAIGALPGSAGLALTRAGAAAADTDAASSLPRFRAPAAADGGRRPFRGKCNNCQREGHTAAECWRPGGGAAQGAGGGAAGRRARH